MARRDASDVRRRHARTRHPRRASAEARREDTERIDQAPATDVFSIFARRGHRYARAVGRKVRRGILGDRCAEERHWFEPVLAVVLATETTSV